jgi:hypothetical protein
MARIIINGVEIASGSSITIFGGEIVVDGVSQKETYPGISGLMEIRILEGVIENIVTDRDVRCGAVGRDVRAGGSVNCDAVGGLVAASGSVNCDDVGGSVTAGGSVNCGDVSGDIRATVVKRG